MTAVVAWTCPACRKTVRTAYCADCGEEPLARHELSMRGVAEKVLHALTSVDARVARTAWQLLRHPGRLTLAWCDGVRKPWVAPFQLFLIANVIFFALQWATSTNVFSSSLDSHLHHQDWSVLAQSLLDERLAARHGTVESYAPLFDRAVVLNAKSLIVLMTMPFALLLPLMFLSQRRPFMLHVAFALHLYTFLLLWFCVALLVAELSKLLGGGGLDAPRVDTVLSVLNLAACGAYLYAAIGPVYGSHGGWRVVQAALSTIAVAAIVLGYRFALFVITLYGT